MIPLATTSRLPLPPESRTFTGMIRQRGQIPTMLAALPMSASVAAAAREAGKIAGCVTYDPAAFEPAFQMGYRFFAAGVDVIFLRSGSAEKLAEFRRRAERPQG